MTEGFFKAFRGEELFCQTYFPKKSKATLVLVHGMAEHSGRYGNFVRYFGDRNYSLSLFDLRGHGKSKGIRAHVDHFGVFIEDLHDFIQWVRSKNPGDKIFLVAHSFGGQIAVNYLAKYPEEVDGCILSSPNLKLAMPVSVVKKMIAQSLSKFLPTLSLGNEVNAEHISRDPKVVRDYVNDKLVQNRMTLRLGAETLTNLSQVMSLAAKIKTPCLILHGENDKITAPQGSKEFYDKMKVKDRKFKAYPGFYHEIFNEPEKEKVFHDIEEWIEKRN